MAINSLYTTTRLMGLSSNMDTETIVKNLMQIEQIKLNRQLRAQTTLQWRQDALKSVSKDMTSFKNTFLTGLGADGMMNSGKYTSYNITVTGGKKDAVNITGTAEAAYMKVVVNKITRLAEGAAAIGGKVSAAGQSELSEGNYIKLGDLKFANDLFTGTKTVDGKEVPDDTVQFSINGVDFTFTKDTTMAQMFSAVNNSAAGVTMTYSRLTDSFSISTRETGANTSLTIENQRGNAFGATSAFGIAETVVRDGAGKVVLDAETGKATHNALHGTNAVVYINNTRVERATNNFYIDGIGYTLNYITGEEQMEQDADGNMVVAQNQTFIPEDAVTANLSKDINSAVDNIKKFIEGYNTMINKLYSLVHEPKSSKYYALTDDEKAAMTDEQVKEWEAMAKSGLLRNDRDLQNVISNLRTAFYTKVSAAGLSAQEIGLRTSGMSGEITINELDLRAALERDSDAVMRVFMGNPASSDPDDAGLIKRLDTIIKDYVNTTQYNTLSSLDRDMTRLAQKISDMEDRMATLEERYYQKYAAMETALSKMQSQLNSINSMLGTSS